MSVHWFCRSCFFPRCLQLNCHNGYLQFSRSQSILFLFCMVMLYGVVCLVFQKLALSHPKRASLNSFNHANIVLLFVSWFSNYMCDMSLNLQHFLHGVNYNLHFESTSKDALWKILSDTNFVSDKKIKNIWWKCQYFRHTSVALGLKKLMQCYKNSNWQAITFINRYIMI